MAKIYIRTTIEYDGKHISLDEIVMAKGKYSDSEYRYFCDKVKTPDGIYSFSEDGNITIFMPHYENEECFPFCSHHKEDKEETLDYFLEDFGILERYKPSELEFSIYC